MTTYAASVFRRFAVIAAAMVLLTGVFLARDEAKASGCGNNVAAWPFTWQYSTGTCAVAGHPGYRLSYQWAVVSGTNQWVCVEGLAFNAYQQKYWAPLGCGTGRAGVSVPWGNVYAMPRVRVKSMLTGTIAGVHWHSPVLVMY